MKNRMIRISANFPSKQKIESCPCGETENMEHVYTCKQLNNEKIEVPYKQLFNGNISEQIIVLKRFRKNFDERETQRNKKQTNNEDTPHVTLCSPQYSDIENCNGSYK